MEATLETMKLNSQMLNLFQANISASLHQAVLSFTVLISLISDFLQCTTHTENMSTI